MENGKTKQIKQINPTNRKGAIKKDMTLIYELSVSEWSSRRMVIVSE